ncbi:hypothetical protein HMPREF1257_02006 [Corynebacterium sp. KPL1814]|nr:hypothetical protein HMPREF1257_02006 [Corynebacterium sp. KPL1814]ERS78718.1 hypothetical protein HMPREF1285_01564 [Corynebacterium sp. KPL1859]
MRRCLILLKGHEKPIQKALDEPNRLLEQAQEMFNIPIPRDLGLSIVKRSRVENSLNSEYQLFNGDMTRAIGTRATFGNDFSTVQIPVIGTGSSLDTSCCAGQFNAILLHNFVAIHIFDD